jgi:hypothetical protein
VWSAPNANALLSSPIKQVQHLLVIIAMKIVEIFIGHWPYAQSAHILSLQLS